MNKKSGSYVRVHMIMYENDENYFRGTSSYTPSCAPLITSSVHRRIQRIPGTALVYICPPSGLGFVPGLLAVVFDLRWLEVFRAQINRMREILFKGVEGGCPNIVKKAVEGGEESHQRGRLSLFLHESCVLKLYIQSVRRRRLGSGRRSSTT